MLLQPSGATSTSVCVTVRLATGVQLSLTTGLPVTAGNMPAAQSTMIFAGHVIDGAIRSLMVMVCTHEATLPHPSMEDHVRTIVPVPLHARLAWSVYPVNTEPQISLAVAVPVTAGRIDDSHEIVIFEGHVIVGGVLS